MVKAITIMQKIKNYFSNHPKEKIRCSELLRLKQFKIMNKTTVRVHIGKLYNKGFLKKQILKCNFVYYSLNLTFREK